MDEAYDCLIDSCVRLPLFPHAVAFSVFIVICVFCCYVAICVVYVGFGSSVTLTIVGVCSRVVLCIFICRCSLV